MLEVAYFALDWIVMPKVFVNSIYFNRNIESNSETTICFKKPGESQPILS